MTIVGKLLEVYADTRGPAICRGCGAAIEWAELVASGKRMCFTGTIVALETRHDADGRLVERVAFDTNHWADCPARDRFRRR